jgi:hypothetical protein
MKLVYNWRQAWKWFSVQFLAVVGLLPLAWQELPDDAKAFLPEGYGPWVLLLLATAGVFGRIIDQNKNVS